MVKITIFPVWDNIVCIEVSKTCDSSSNYLRWKVSKPDAGLSYAKNAHDEYGSKDTLIMYRHIKKGDDLK